MAEKKLEQIALEALIPYARNARKHSDEQVAQLAASIREFGFNAPVLVDAENGIIAGHGRVLAARKLGLEAVPCLRLDHLSDTQRRAYILADNRLAELGGGWDEEMLKLEVKEIDWAELNQISIDDFKFGELDFDAKQKEGSELSENYTHKVETPVYEPKGERPAFSDMIDESRSNSLIEKIQKAQLPVEVTKFLTIAAQRHTVFNFEKIAEYYCHADKQIQELMEDSALVIIDFKKAMQLGYVKLKEEIAEALAGETEPDSADE